jgi:DNA-binding GntR family transcriptional regulator
MARGARVVVQADRLRDQVYELIRDDMRSGVLTPGQRLVEVDLAEKYGVSRTPVREALFQLTRSGYLDGTERGYSVPIYSKKDVIDRLEVKQLLVSAVVEHVAKTATALQIKRLTKLYEQEAAAQAAGSVARFIAANQDFRQEYCEICENRLLARCLAMVEDHFEIARGRIHQLDENRRLSLEHDSRLLAAIAAHDSAAAAAEVDAFLVFLDGYYAEHAPTGEPQEA